MEKAPTMLFAGLLLLIGFEVGAAQFVAGTGPFPRVSLHGEIVEGDYERYLEIVQRAFSFPSHLMVNSPGGNVLEAIKLGRLVRKSLTTTSVLGVCNSACFLIWAGGVERETISQIGLHRPTFDSQYFVGLNPDEARQKYSELSAMVEEYLLEMTIPQHVIDRMMATSSSRVDYMQAETIANEIDQYDPSYQEWQIANCGELSDAEEADYEAVMKLKSHETLIEEIRSAETQSGRELLQNVHESVHAGSEDSRRYARGLSEGYRNYLWEKYSDIVRCLSPLTISHQRDLFYSLGLNGPFIADDFLPEREN